LHLQSTIQISVILILLIYIGWKESAKVEAMPKTEEGSKAETFLGPKYQACVIEVPRSVTFAGAEISLEEPDLRERFDRELHVNANWHSNTILLIKRANRWLPKMAEILKANGIPEDFKYLAVIESSLEEHARSPQDAIGFWQLLKGTAQDFGLEVNNEVDERYDPIKSTEAACKYLKKSYGKFGSWPNVAASYNIGVRGFERRMDEQQVDSYFDILLNEETARYMFRILAVKAILEAPENYGFHIAPDQLYEPAKVEIVEVDKNIPDLVAFAQSHNITYKTLKRHNPWLRDKKLTVGRKTYQIKISQEPAEQYVKLTARATE
jgi:membrane-bound lytic murein transglycosylase D